MEYNLRRAMEWSRQSSRVVFGNVLNELAEQYPDCMVIAADVASSAGLQQFAAEHPRQFVNTGIAEMNAVAMATGMAEAGYNVFAVSFAPFASMRCFEAARTYAGYMHANVKIVGIASGLSMGVGGNTHFGLEDVALMRTIPGMTVVSPADCMETAKAVEAALQFNGPMYLRLTGVNGNPIVYKDDYSFSIGKGIVLRDGEDVALLACGMMVNEAVRAARVLSKEGISATVVDMHTVKPLDEALVRTLCKGIGRIVTIEEHSKIGGLGAAVAEFAAAEQIQICQKIIALEDAFGPNGSYQYLTNYHKLTAKQIAEEVSKFVKGEQNL